jgi:hypothetical protein
MASWGKQSVATASYPQQFEIFHSETKELAMYDTSSTTMLSDIKELAMYNTSSITILQDKSQTN